MLARVEVRRVASYDVEAIERVLPDGLFDVIEPGDAVVLKPNWVLEGHQKDPRAWEHVITHPAVITAVLRKVLARLGGAGRVSILDAPTTEASFRALLARYPVAGWQALARTYGTRLEILDLRDWEWRVRDGVVVARTRLPGDPRGGTEVDLVGAASEFHGHRRSVRGYYGADYDRAETNRAHDGHHNLYRVSRTALAADVFVNLPKLKTHRKAGITSCLKNLVGINTYKNFLPHHSEGGPSDGGDQYPTDGVHARVEGPLRGFLGQHLLQHPSLARALAPAVRLGRRLFGDTQRVVRSGNWHGNDTIWRMILDLNKVLRYANEDGTLRPGEAAYAKRYVGIVDAVVAGDGNGPLAPDPVEMGYLVCGGDAVAIDAACAALMGFDPSCIPTIARAPEARRYPLCDGSLDDVRIVHDGREVAVAELPAAWVVPCTPHHGWRGRIERTEARRVAAG